MILIDGTNAILGRLSSNIAEKLLKGEHITIVNSEKIIITGTRNSIYEKFKKRLDAAVKSNPEYGPKYPKFPDRLVRRTVRGMLPFKTLRGKTAYKNLHVFIGIPEELKNSEFQKITTTNLAGKKFMTIEELSKILGAVY